MLLPGPKGERAAHVRRMSDREMDGEFGRVAYGRSVSSLVTRRCLAEIRVSPRMMMHHLPDHLQVCFHFQPAVPLGTCRPHISLLNPHHSRMHSVISNGIRGGLEEEEEAKEEEERQWEIPARVLHRF